MKQRAKAKTHPQKKSTNLPPNSVVTHPVATLNRSPAPTPFRPNPVAQPHGVRVTRVFPGDSLNASQKKRDEITLDNK